MVIQGPCIPMPPMCGLASGCQAVPEPSRLMGKGPSALVMAWPLVAWSMAIGAASSVAVVWSMPLMSMPMSWPACGSVGP
jgi:hypothetical protein